ncbi:hypothetical protein [Wolbachia endosymbiont (group A) of Chalcis sispes]|uniref:hypothetical protein n=1 Tax=Wolbachia endosymbiont (group A) of Chalcis sispes TaxID=3066197 RepID=UPI003132DD4B
MNKNITFKALKEEHFLLLLKWLETPHVKRWWDADINWTPELIEKNMTTMLKLLLSVLTLLISSYFFNSPSKLLQAV